MLILFLGPQKIKSIAKSRKESGTSPEVPQFAFRTNKELRSRAMKNEFADVAAGFFYPLTALYQHRPHLDLWVCL